MCSYADICCISFYMTSCDLRVSWFPFVCLLVRGIYLCLLQWLLTLNPLNVLNYLLYLLQVMGMESHHLSIQFGQIQLWDWRERGWENPFIFSFAFPRTFPQMPEGKERHHFKRTEQRREKKITSFELQGPDS